MYGIVCRQVLTSVHFAVLNVLSNLSICLQFKMFLMYSTNLLLCLTVFNLIYNFWQLLEHFIVPFCHVQLSYYSLLMSLF